MTIPKAISILREKLGGQRELAAKLGTTIETISRWENSRREPTREALQKLAELAAAVGLPHMQAFFTAQRTKAVKANIRNLPSAGTQRRVALGDLQRWSNHYLVSIIDSIETSIERTDVNTKAAALQNAIVTAQFLQREIFLHEGGKKPIYSSSDLQQHQEWLQRNKPFVLAAIKALEKELTEGQPNRKEKRSDKTK